MSSDHWGRWRTVCLWANEEVKGEIKNQCCVNGAQRLVGTTGGESSNHLWILPGSEANRDIQENVYHVSLRLCSGLHRSRTTGCRG